MSGRLRSASPAGASILGVVIVLLMVAAVPLGLAAHQVAWSDLPQALLLIAPFAGVGIVVARRRPANPIGWIFLLVSLGLLLGQDAASYAVRAYRIDGHGLPLSRLAVCGRDWLGGVCLVAAADSVVP